MMQPRVDIKIIQKTLPDGYEISGEMQSKINEAYAQFSIFATHLLIFYGQIDSEIKEKYNQD